MLTNID